MFGTNGINPSGNGLPAEKVVNGDLGNLTCVNPPGWPNIRATLLTSASTGPENEMRVIDFVVFAEGNAPFLMAVI